MSLQLIDLGQDVGGVQLGHAGVDLLETYRTLLVDDYDRPAGPAVLIVVDAVELGHRPVWVEVAQDGIGDAAQRSRKGSLNRLGVDAYTQYLGIPLLELRVRCSKRGDLVRSAACERIDVYGKDYVLAAELA